MTIGASEILDELRDLLEDGTAEVAESYPVWVISEGSQRLKDAWFAQQIHHQVKTASGLTYARSSVRDGQLELDELGNPTMAARVEIAASKLTPGGTRLLLVPARQVMALWKPADASVVMVLSAASSLAPGTMFTADSFERVLSQIKPEADSAPLASNGLPGLVDHETWTRRTANERGAGA
ncbi:MAG: hypothetical protein LAP38_28715 [Acidobacteriia bacterium]|nr:hypothetical protein [Terriglobia bacterium]